MGELASKQQLRMSFARWALVTVPLILFLGFLMGRLSNSGFENGWFAALAKPAWFPPGWAFPVVWSLLYVMLGIAIAIILDARGAAGRVLALGLFVAQILFNFAWSPTFFAAHKVSLALWIIIACLLLTIATTFAFARVRKPAAWLLVPYMGWLSFAALLNLEMDRLNPNAETLETAQPKANISL